MTNATPYRLLDGIFNYGEMFTYPNRLVGVGAHVVMHAHEFDHMMITWPGVGNPRYLLEAIVDGKSVTRELGPCECAYVKAGVHHKLTMIAGEEGGFICVFSKYGPNGERRADVLASFKEDV